MRLASYNVENMFLRAVALNQDELQEGRAALETQVQLNELFSKAAYSDNDKRRILESLEQLALLRDDSGGRFAILRQNHGKLLTRHNDGTVSVRADGRASWLGWVDLKVQEVNEVATRMTARVVNDVDADVLAVVEAESRPALVRFARNLVTPEGPGGYEHLMLIDGNDERGIDVGIMTKAGFEITSMVSHVDDTDQQGLVFSRDCPVYWVKTPAGNSICVIPNHLKSKAFGSSGSNDQRRRRQAARIRQIYEALLASGHSLVAIVGDFNDTLDSDTLAPLTDSSLRDISSTAGFDPDRPEGRPGTYRNCTAGEKIDHILLSPDLFARASAGGVNRMGIWGGVNGTLFPHYDEITRESEAASDHGAVWADLDV
jgi:endonuclease/exonuclease/phosphatase family metal-dependent hydrolase